MLPADWRATTAKGGPRALEIFAADPTIDVVLCDLMMPVMTGCGLYERLGARDDGAERRVVFMTGGAITEETRAFLQRAGRVVLKKPFDGEELARALPGVTEAFER